MKYFSQFIGILRNSPVYANAGFIFLIAWLSIFSQVLNRDVVGNFAWGCDSFGYERQAQLFRSQGIGGLATEIKADEARFLIDIAKSINLSQKYWYQMVAPHCHHFKESSDKIVLQYPPGTGLLLSMFDQSWDAQFVFKIFTLIPLICIGVICAINSVSLVCSLSIVVIIAVLAPIILSSEINASLSVPLSTGLGSIAALIATLLTQTNNSPKLKLGLCAALGLVSGYLILVRLPNIFIVAGILSYIALHLSGTSKTVSENRMKLLLAIVCTFFLFGLVPLLITNYVNTGNALLTTYSEADSTSFVFNIEILKNNFNYYISKSPAAPSIFLVVIIASMLLMLVFSGDIQTEKKKNIRNTLLAILVVIGLNFTYFGFHSIQNPYYMWPGNFFVILFGAFNLIVQLSSLEPIRRSSMLLQMAILGIVLGSVAFHNFASISRASYRSVMPEEVLRPEAIVWADLTSGTILTYNSKYAAKLNFGSICAQEKVIRRISEIGRPQYLVIDSDDMKKIMDRLSTHAQFIPVGQFESYTKIEVYRLHLLDQEGPANCPV